MKSFTEFHKMDDRAVQEIFRDKIFLVKDYPTRLRFDLDGLSHLGNIDEERTFHGTSVVGL